jgi:hypothetical protein
VCLLAVGDRVAAALEAADLLGEAGIEAAVWDVRSVRPADAAMLDAAAAAPLVVTVENGVVGGGAAPSSPTGWSSAGVRHAPPVLKLGVPDGYLQHGKPDRILAELGLDAAGHRRRDAQGAGRRPVSCARLGGRTRLAPPFAVPLALTAQRTRELRGARRWATIARTSVSVRRSDQPGAHVLRDLIVDASGRVATLPSSCSSSFGSACSAPSAREPPGDGRFSRRRSRDHRSRGGDAGRARGDDETMQITGAQAVMKSLEAARGRHRLRVPGRRDPPGLRPPDRGGADHVLVRHEQGAVHMAEGYAHATGRVGVCIVTSGPAATNLVTGLADAHMDSIPVLAITGQVATTRRSARTRSRRRT